MNVLKTDTVVGLAGISYHLGSRIEKSLPVEFDTQGSVVPAVALDVQGQPLTVDLLQSTFSAYEQTDDVFHPAFTEGGIIIACTGASEEPTATLPETLTQYLNGLSSRLLFIGSEGEALPNGPYFLRGRHLHKAWRLYPDENLAFTLPVVPSGGEGDDAYSFEPLRAGAYSGLHPVVAVPSRLYYSPSKEKPLAGLRVTVKDNFHLRGVHTTLASRSYARLYGPQTETAAVVKTLVDMGAVIVGKTKMGAYAGSEVPPEKCIDYFAPWSPRGDGYQGPSGSSSGAGSSVASYDWIDVGLGTDSTGSIRMPAASYGLWGLRATLDYFNLDGIMPSVPPFDTLGLLTRTPEDLRKLISVGSPPKEQGSEVRRPTNIIYPTDWFPMGNEKQQAMVDEFLKVLETTLRIKVTRVSFETMWSETGPESLRETSLLKYLDKSIYWPNYYDGSHTYDQFREDFQAKYNHQPYASPFMTKRWGLADDITMEQRDQGLRELSVYYDWALEHILKPDTEHNFVLVPLGRPGANYRDLVPAPGGEFSTSAYNAASFSTVLGLPQLVVPIGQNPYESRVTSRTEYAPIVASLVGPRGSDLSLVSLVKEALDIAQWPTEVLTGSVAFRVGDSPRHVETGAKNNGSATKL